MATEGFKGLTKKTNSCWTSTVRLIHTRQHSRGWVVCFLVAHQHNRLSIYSAIHVSSS